MSQYIRFDSANDDETPAKVRQLWQTTAAHPHSKSFPCTVIVSDEDEESVLEAAEALGLRVAGKGGLVE